MPPFGVSDYVPSVRHARAAINSRYCISRDTRTGTLWVGTHRDPKSVVFRGIYGSIHVCCVPLPASLYLH